MRNLKKSIGKKMAVSPKKVEKNTVKFIRDTLKQAGFSRVVLGLSGGLDSATVAYLSCKALGRGNVYPVLLPYKLSSNRSRQDALRVIKNLKIPAKNVDMINISPQIDAWLKNNPFDIKKSGGRIRLGNKLARERMSVLYDKSAEFNALVIGTSNMSETAVGYGTIYGDMACALNPIGNLYKTQERQIAAVIPELEFLSNKMPTADLWPGQTDEGELKITYQELDEILYGLINMGLGREELIKAGYESKKINSVITRIKSSQFKRVPVPITKINNRFIPVNLKEIKF